MEEIMVVCMSSIRVLSDYGRNFPGRESSERPAEFLHNTSSHPTSGRLSFEYGAVVVKMQYGTVHT